MSPTSLNCLSPGIILAFLRQMVNNDWICIKIVLNVIQHGTNLGPGPWMGGLNEVPSLASADLCDEMAQVYYFCRVSGSVMDLNLAHILNVIFYHHKLPELHEPKFWENVKSSIFTKISLMDTKTAKPLLVLG